MAQLNNNIDSNQSSLFLPKLRRNKKLEEKFGEKYFTALKQAIFTPFDDPYVPPEPPELLRGKDNTSFKHYKCKQCNDCFSFESTYNDHINRRSWILGYWCGTCYSPPCTHVSNKEASCKVCVNLEEKKRWYLRARGLRKGHKRGMIRIFYNQCSFFAHLQSHDTRTVDPSDLMLMPFPSAIETADYSKLDALCCPLFERMFLLRKHVVDWLKSRDIYDNWWKIGDVENSPIQFLTKGYKCDDYFEEVVQSLLKNQENQKEENEKNSNRESPVCIDLDNSEERDGDEEEEEEERSDDPCPPVDIAFVDCGPMPKTYVVNPSKMNQENSKKAATTPSSSTPKISVKKFASDLNWNSSSPTGDKPVPNLTQKPQKAVAIAPALIPINSSGGAILQGSTKLNPDAKLLTVRGPKDVNLSTLIQKLPHDIISNKQIVFVGQQTAKPGALKSNALPTTYKSIMPDMNDINKPKFIRILPTPNRNVTTFVQTVNTQSLKPLDTKVNGILDRKNTFNLNLKGVQKFVMAKKLEKAPIMQSPGLVRPVKVPMKNFVKTTGGVTIVAPLTSTMIQNGTSEKNKVQSAQDIVLKCLETDATGELLRVCEDASKNLILKSVPKQVNSNVKALVARYRQEMLSKIQKMTQFDVDLRMDHFKMLMRRCRQVVGMWDGHKSMLNFLNKAYEKAMPFIDVNNDDQKDQEYEAFLSKWELGLHYVEQKRCPNCNKVYKPDSYIFGLSRETKNPTHYCACADFICYMCNLYHGTASRFEAHLEYHKKQDTFVCPECYQMFSNYKELMVHGWTSCFHVLTRRMLGCNICQIGGFEDLEKLARHFAVMHCNKMVSCPICIRVFKTHAVCKQHMQQEHPKQVNVKPFKILTCDVGGCVINPKHFRSHMINHIGTQTLLYYKCPVCSSFIKDTDKHTAKDLIKLHLYVYHYKQLSSIIEKDVLDEILSQGFPESIRKINETMTPNQKKNSFDPKIVNVGTISVDVFDGVDESDSNITHSDGGSDIISMNSSSSGIDNNAKSMKIQRNSWKPNSVSSNPKKEGYANISDANAFLSRKDETASSPRKKIKRKPGRIALNEPSKAGSTQSQDYKCHLCGELINTSWSVVRHHFGTKHADTYQLSILTPKLLRISNEFIERGYQEYLSKKRKIDGSSNSPQKRRKRWTPKKHTDGTTTEKLSGMCVMPESSQDNDGNFVCKKCEKACKNEQDLHEHIASSHRIKGMYLICLECGENFIVAPSLQMHLKAFHAIDDPISYLEQNPLHAAESVDDLEEKMKAVVANQCHVCMAVFENKAAVDKHFRVHGMAFLNRKRIEARNAIKSPEKEKIEGEPEELVMVEADEKEGSSAGDKE